MQMGCPPQPLCPSALLMNSWAAGHPLPPQNRFIGFKGWHKTTQGQGKRRSLMQMGCPPPSPSAPLLFCGFPKGCPTGLDVLRLILKRKCYANRFRMLSEIL